MNPSPATGPRPSARSPLPPLAHLPELLPERETWIESFRAALPLFVVGGACIGAAILLYETGSVTGFGGSGTVHLRTWPLFAALGVTGVAAGTVAIIPEEVSVDSVQGRYGRSGRKTPYGTASRRTPGPPVWQETSPESGETAPTGAGGQAPESPDRERDEAAALDATLRQFDELHATLKKKAESRKPD